MPALRPAARRVFSDVFALCSGVAVLVWLGWLVYFLLPRDVLPGFPPEGPQLVVLTAAMALATPMWCWMVADCAARLVRLRDPYLAAWLVAIVIVPVTAWVYYAVARRRREECPAEAGRGSDRIPVRDNGEPTREGGGSPEAEESDP